MLRPIETCPICHQDCTRSLTATTSPGIRTAYAQGVWSPPRSVFCSDCEHVFLCPRLANDEAARHFVEDEEFRHEEEDNALLRASERCQFYDEFLEGATEIHGLVVDYGCGNGYFGRYMFPRADVVGVGFQAMERGIDIPDLLSKADFLICSRVLQQVPEPLTLLSFLKSGLRPHTPAWLEFPISYEIPLRASFELQETLAASSVTTDSKILGYRDEVAYFSVRSARNLASRSGFMVSEIMRSDRGGALALRAKT